jgi:arsenite methyltransferase
MRKDVKTIVKETYTRVVKDKSSGCCAPPCCSPSSVETQFSESYDSVEGYVKEADYGLGCGIPTEFVEVREGDTVLDLGSGAGNDVFVASRMVGEKGLVIGLDMTEAMVEQARANKKKLGVENVEFVLGEIESMPIRENSVDVVISNCVLNLVPDKHRAYGEINRVLRPGGSFSISDIVVEGEMSPAVRQAAALYAGCVSGALSRKDYLEAISGNHFRDVAVVKERKIEIPDALLLEHLSREEAEAFRKSEVEIFSITVTGKK